MIYNAKIAGGVETTSSSTKNKNTLKKGKFCLIRFTKSGEHTAMRRIQAKRDWCIISPYSEDFRYMKIHIFALRWKDDQKILAANNYSFQ